MYGHVRIVFDHDPSYKRVTLLRITMCENIDSIMVYDIKTIWLQCQMCSGKHIRAHLSIVILSNN